MTLRWRLNLMIGVVAVLIILFGAGLVVYNARWSVASELDSTLNLALQLLESELSEAKVIPESPEALEKRMVRLGNARHLTVSLRSPAQQDLESKQPETQVEPAGIPGWFTWSVAPQRLVARSRVSTAEGQQLSIVVQADPSDEIHEAWREAVSFFAIVVVLAFSVSLLVFVIVGRAFRPVSVILQGLERIQQGEYGARLPDFPLPEFTRVSRAVNHAAQVLENAESESRTLSQHELDVREQERQFLAEELHDEFGQSLSAVKAVSMSLKNTLDDADSRASVDSILATSDRLFSVLRNIMRRLHPLVLEDLGLKAAMDDMVEHWIEGNPGVSIEYQCDSAVDRVRSVDQIHVYRIVQECLTNIVRHAHADQIRIVLAVNGDSEPWSSTYRLSVEVMDNGVGFKPGRPSGVGLKNIRARVGTLNGLLAIQSAPGSGTRVHVDLPLQSEAS